MVVAPRRNSQEGAPRRNSLLNDIEEEKSSEFNADLNLEFHDSDDDESISLGFDDAMVGDEELRLSRGTSRSPQSQNGSVEECCMDEEEGQSKKDKSITERLQKRTRRAKTITWGLFLLLCVITVVASFFMTRHDDCREKRDEVKNPVHNQTCTA